MSRYRKVDPRVWNDAKFRSLSDQGKLVFFFLLTHPHMTAIGAMRASIPGLAAEIGWDVEAFREAFMEALSKGMALHDEKASLVWLPNFLKYNPPESPNVVKAWINSLDLLPECELLTRVIASTKAFAEALTDGFGKALPEAFAKAMPYQEQEQEQEQEHKKKHLSPPSDHLPCPVEKLVELYHKHLPDNPKCKVLNEGRRKAIRQRWREAASIKTSPFGYTTQDDGLKAWAEFFSVCATSDFLTGKVPGMNGRPPFLADIEFLFTTSGFAKCLENKYHREVSA